MGGGRSLEQSGHRAGLLSPLLAASSQILFLSGLVFIIGFRRTFTFFFQRQKMKGSSFFLGGVLIVLMRWPLLGMLLEAYGFITLFRSAWTHTKPTHATSIYRGRLNRAFCFGAGVFSPWLLAFWARW